MSGPALIYDDLSLWAAPFGLKLLDTARLRRGITVVDIGTGGGFPLIELAQRLDPSSRNASASPGRAPRCLLLIGSRSTLYGIDSDNDILALARAKAAALELGAGQEAYVAGINNVADAEQVLHRAMFRPLPRVATPARFC